MATAGPRAPRRRRGSTQSAVAPWQGRTEAVARPTRLIARRRPRWRRWRGGRRSREVSVRPTQGRRQLNTLFASRPRRSLPIGIAFPARRAVADALHLAASRVVKAGLAAV